MNTQARAALADGATAAVTADAHDTTERPGPRLRSSRRRPAARKLIAAQPPQYEQGWP